MTVIEVMIAIIVLGVAIMAAFLGEGSSMRLLQAGRETRTALTDARGAMEEILIQPIDDLPVAGSAYADGAPIQSYEGRNLTDQRVVATYPNWGGGAVPDPLEIVVTVTWTDARGGARTLRLGSVKTR